MFRTVWCTWCGACNIDVETKTKEVKARDIKYRHAVSSEIEVVNANESCRMCGHSLGGLVYASGHHRPIANVEQYTKLLGMFPGSYGAP